MKTIDTLAQISDYFKSLEKTYLILENAERVLRNLANECFEESDPDDEELRKIESERDYFDSLQEDR